MSLFPEIDKEISEIERDFKKYVADFKDSTELYSPCNGSEGSLFYDMFCTQCSHDDGENKLCDVSTMFMFNGSHEQIRKDKDGEIICFSASWIDERFRNVFDKNKTNKG